MRKIEKFNINFDSFILFLIRKSKYRKKTFAFVFTFLLIPVH